MADVTIPDGYLDHVTVAWHRVAEYERDDDGEIVVDPRTRQPHFLGLSDRWRAHPIGWIEIMRDGAWCLA